MKSNLDINQSSWLKDMDDNFINTSAGKPPPPTKQQQNALNVYKEQLLRGEPLVFPFIIEEDNIIKPQYLCKHFYNYVDKCVLKYTSIKEQIDLVTMFIVRSKDTCSGQPRIKNTRLTVNDVVLVINEGPEHVTEFLQDRNDYITHEMIDACILYYKLNLL